MRVLASIPSPSQSVWHLGPLPIRAYALCIVLGIFVAVWLTIRRWRDVGGVDEDIWDVAGWAIVFGIIGGRLYHVITDPELYFKAVPPDSSAHPLNAFKIWDGGLGIWGAVALGGVGAWIGCRRKGIRLSSFADAAAPGIVLAQGIGRWGNWFNNELYGGPTSLPWRLEIHRVDVVTGQSLLDDHGHAIVLGYFQPTFLYESIWDIALAFVLIYASRRWTLGRGNVFALYVMLYTVGRAWIEALREDHANHILGLRLNDWTSIIVFIGALIWFLRNRSVPSGPIYTDDRREAAADSAAEPDALADAATGDDLPAVTADGSPDGTAEAAPDVTADTSPDTAQQRLD
ncbi:prolipoprotein diacylglyceryl transferase [Frankineae bacterium MT45]|nr:prolipoprotein diacylglyceryl transferase [Frankineae bacterium MT45]